ncbi:MAG: hypothetical protein M3256_06220 [Actinomycetota bacterium]|nr:hypothetical protein [Actinomycetota bacterium]
MHPPPEGFTRWDFAHRPSEHTRRCSTFPTFDFIESGRKEPDLILALHLRDDTFTGEEKLRDFEYYGALTVRDSSLW